MKRAFTLIELIVVIAMISLLVGILLPAMARARKASLSLDCLTRLRSLAQVAAIYKDNHKVLPVAHEYASDADLEIWDVPSTIFLCPSRDNFKPWRYSYLAGAFMQHNLMAADPDPELAQQVTQMYEVAPGLPLLEDAGDYHDHMKNMVQMDGSAHSRR